MLGSSLLVAVGSPPRLEIAREVLDQSPARRWESGAGIRLQRQLGLVPLPCKVKKIKLDQNHDELFKIETQSMP